MYWLKIALFSIIDREKEDSNNYIIARYILENYNRLSGVSLTDIAQQCNLSKAAVSRFCKELGLLDYVDLQMLIRTSGKYEEKAKSNYTVEQQKEEFINQTSLTFNNFKSALDDPNIEELLKDIKKYDSIYTFGHLQASHVAYILSNNLAISNKFCFCTQSWLDQKEKLEKASSKDLFIIFSSSGDYFKRMDVNMSFLDKENRPKIYMISSDRNDKQNDKITTINLGSYINNLQSNIAMDMFVNYIDYRYRNL